MEAKISIVESIANATSAPDPDTTAEANSTGTPTMFQPRVAYSNRRPRRTEAPRSAGCGKSPIHPQRLRPPAQAPGQPQTPFWRYDALVPTTTFLLRHLAAVLDDHPDGFDLPLLDTAAAMGLGHRGGANGPFLRAIARATQFKITRSAGPGALGVRRRVAPLNRTQLDRLPGPLRDEHAAWQQAAARTPDLDQQRRRARRLALSLAELGESDEAIEQQLHRWQIHPALAHEALRWALVRQRGAPVAPVAPVRRATFSPSDTPPPGVPAHAIPPTGDAA